MSNEFRVSITADFYKDGSPLYQDFGLSVFEDQPQIKIETFKEHQGEIGPEQIANSQQQTLRLSAATGAEQVKKPRFSASVRQTGAWVGRKCNWKVEKV